MQGLNSLVDSEGVNLRDLMRFCAPHSKYGVNNHDDKSASNSLMISFLTNFMGWMPSKENQIKALQLYNSVFETSYENFDALFVNFSNFNANFKINESKEIIYSQNLNHHGSTLQLANNI